MRKILKNWRREYRKIEYKRHCRIYLYIKLAVVLTSLIHYLNFLSTEVVDRNIIFRNEGPGTFESNLRN